MLISDYKMNSPDPSNDDMADDTGDGEQKKSEKDINQDEGVLEYQDIDLPKAQLQMITNKKDTTESSEEKMHDANYNTDDANVDKNDANDNESDAKEDDYEENENDYNGDEYEGNDEGEEDDYEFEEEGEGAGHTRSVNLRLGIKRALP